MARAHRDDPDDRVLWFANPGAAFSIIGAGFALAAFIQTKQWGFALLATLLLVATAVWITIVWWHTTRDP